MFFSGVYVLADKPWVLAVADNTLATATRESRAAGQRPHYLVFRTWYGGDLRGGIAALRLLARARFPKVTWMCNAPAEVAMLRSLGQRAIFCHHNLFCNENVFDIQPNPVEYDAIYIARLDPYKRIWLARDIPKLRIVTANPKDAIRLKDWGCNHANVNQEFMEYTAIAREISKSCCGLALSKKEGGMLATTEYLLCGKPVITTPSLGGREYWLDSSNSLNITDSAPDIASAVRLVGNSTWDSNTIRQSALIRLQCQRGILLEYLEKLTKQMKRPAASQMDADWLYQQFVLVKDMQRFLTTSR
ncbi:MAG: glycosyltransferase family 4 protein [Pirellula sp.]|jgi:glycosyltransferase involved in cell wall biosynthesis